MSGPILLKTPFALSVFIARCKGLKLLYEEGNASKIQPELAARIMRRLESLAGATRPEDTNLPGYNFHKLQGEPKRYSIHVNGPWCIVFGWEEDGAAYVDLKNYH